MICLQVENSTRLDDFLSGSQPAVIREVLDERSLRRMIAVERKRTERTKEPFLLMLLECVECRGPGKCIHGIDTLVNVLLSATRETDVIGWHKEHRAIAILFTGLVHDSKSACVGAILNRVSAALQDKLFSEQFVQLSITLHLFPDDWGNDASGGPSNPALYPELQQAETNKRGMLVLKRVIDIVGSMFLL